MRDARRCEIAVSVIGPRAIVQSAVIGGAQAFKYRDATLTLYGSRNAGELRRLRDQLEEQIRQAQAGEKRGKQDAAPDRAGLLQSLDLYLYFFVLFRCEAEAERQRKRAEEAMKKLEEEMKILGINSLLALCYVNRSLVKTSGRQSSSLRNFGGSCASCRIPAAYLRP